MHVPTSLGISLEPGREELRHSRDPSDRILVELAFGLGAWPQHYGRGKKRKAASSSSSNGGSYGIASSIYDGANFGRTI